MRVHTGGFVTMGTGGSYVQFRKKITKISSEAELFRVYDVLTQVICTRYLLKEKGFEIHDNFIYQDNQSAVKLYKNGRQSSNKQTCHINIRYYFITDSIKKQE